MSRSTRLPTGFLAFLLLLLSFDADPAHAALQWYPRQLLPGGASRVALGPDGVGLLFGFDGRHVVRPLGGPPSALQNLPTGMQDSFYLPFVSWFPDGSALLGHNHSARIAFRPAGAGSAIGASEFLTGFGIQGIAPAATGDALLASDGTVKVAFRPAGAASTVDLDDPQSFGSGRLIGVVADPAGGAVVVFVESSKLMQAVRDAGESSFGTPTEITAPGLGPSIYRVSMAADPSGYAVLGWLGKSPSATSFGDTIVAAVRAPGEAFGTPASVGTTPVEDVTDVIPGVTASGDAVVAWSQLNALSNCSPARDHDFGAYYAIARDGIWGGPTALGGVAWPDGSGVDAVASAGDHVAIAFFTEHHTAARCVAADDTRELFVRTATSGATALDFDSAISIAQSQSNGGSQFQIPGLGALAVNASGGVLVTFSEGEGSSPFGYKSWVRARENLDGVPTPTATVTATSGTATPTPIATATATAAVPPHVADEDAAKAADKCATGIAKAANGLLKTKAKGLAQCADGLFGCIQTKESGAKRDDCVTKVRAKCDAAFEKTAAAGVALTAKVGKACGALDPQLLINDAGLGFAELPCASVSGAAATDAASAAACVRAHHECAAERLLALEIPRARELLMLAGAAVPGCLDGGVGAGLAIGDVVVGKTLGKCEKAIEKSSAAFATGYLASLQKCLDGVFGCVQLKNDATQFPACLAKVGAACNKGVAKVTKIVASGRESIDEKCGAIGAPLFDAAGVDLDAPAAVCAAHQVGALASLGDYELCLVRQHQCLVQEMVTFETPRAVELLGLVGLGLQTTFCGGN